MASRTAGQEAYFRDPRHYLTKAPRILRRRDLVQELLGDVSGLHVLDLGSGTGAISAPFTSRNRVTMVDSSPGMVGLAGDYAAEHVLGDLTTYSGPAADIVLCIGVLAHVEESGPVIEAVARNLRSAGRCILQLSDAEAPVNRVNRLVHDFANRLGRRLRYRPTPLPEVLALARDNGLRLIDQRRHLLVVPGMQRLLGPLLAPYDRLVANSRLSRFGSEHLLLLQKD
jgi:SAM-dependent methyltransferase